MPTYTQSSSQVDGASSQFLSDHAQAYLDGSVREVEVRPITHADIAAFASREASSTFEAYRMRPEGDLVPVVVDVVGNRRGGVSTHTTFAIDANGRVNRAEPVGARIRVEMRDGEGKRSDAFLFTTEAAEEASALGGNQGASTGRERLFLPADRPIPAAQQDRHSDQTGQGGGGDLQVFIVGAGRAADIHADLGSDAGPDTVVLTLAPVHGSQVRATFVVADTAPRDLERRMREVLVREFGESLGALVDLSTSVVAPERVDVRDADTGDLIAVNVLAAEATYMSHDRVIVTEPSRGGVIVG